MPSIKSVSASQSVVSTDKSVMDADSVEVCTVYITCNLDFQDANGQPYPIGGVPATLVTIAIAEGGVVITQPSGNLSATGGTTATFTASTATSKTIVATVNGVAVSNSPVVVAGGAVTPPAGGDPFFTDTFAGTQKNDSGGFTWNATTSRVSVVSWEGVNALRFRYGPDADLGDSSAEQRFNMGRNLTEVWIEYYLWVPSNYVNRAQTGGINNKLMRLWGDAYASANKVGMSTYVNAAYTPDSAVIRFEYNYKGYADGTLSAGPVFSTGVAFGGDMKGAWTRIRQHYLMVSGTDADDALMELWIGATKVVTFANVPQKYDTAKPYWNNGYFFGWANTGFLDETDFYIKGGADGPKFYDADPGWT